MKWKINIYVNFVDGPLEYDISYDNMRLLTNNSENADIVKVNVPYNTSLLMQECMAMGICMRLIPKEVPNYEKLNIVESGEFVLQDADKRNLLLKIKIKKTKIISKSKKNRRNMLIKWKVIRLLLEILLKCITGRFKKFVFKCWSNI